MIPNDGLLSLYRDLLTELHVLRRAYIRVGGGSILDAHVVEALLAKRNPTRLEADLQERLAKLEELRRQILESRSNNFARHLDDELLQVRGDFPDLVDGRETN